MKRKTAVLLVIAIMIACTLCGCGSFSFNSAENLIRPPKLSGDDGKLQAAFENALTDKGEYILKYPSSGDYRSAYVRYDVDGDGRDEAFVFYSLKAEAMNIYMYMLDFSETGDWIPVGEVMGDGNDIFLVEFCDLNDDGVAEVLVGWSSLDIKVNKKLSVYASAAEDTIDYKAVAIETYTEMYTVDLDGDGEKEIFTVLINSTSDTYTTEARLLKMTGESNSGFKMSPVGQVSLYSEMTAVMGIVSGTSEGKRYIYIDEAAGNTYLTELVYWDSVNDALVMPLKVDMISVSSLPTSRSLPMKCADIDGDGEIEIPSTVLHTDSSIIMRSETSDDAAALNSGPEVNPANVYVTNWNKFAEGKFTTVCSYINNQNDEFKIKYDKDKMKNRSVIMYPEDHLTQVFLITRKADPEAADETTLLFSINAVEKSESVSIGSYLLTGENYKYTLEITEAGEKLGITKSYVMSIFDLSGNQEIYGK